MSEQEFVFDLHDNHAGDTERRSPTNKLDMEVDHQMISELARRTVAGMLIAISSGAELATRVKTYIDERQRDGR